jgi:hypothetical protein
MQALGCLVLSGRRLLTQPVVFEKDVLGGDVPLAIVDLGFGVRQGLQKLITFFSGWAGLQKLITDLDMKNGYKGGA